jgi:hypothetical protein
MTHLSQWRGVVKAIGVLWLVFSCSGTGNAQAFQNAGFAGAQFLKIGVGARAMGMGGAYASLAGDATALAWNPAGIGPISTIAFSAQHNLWVEGMTHDFIGLVVPITDQINLGFHTVFLSTGDIEMTTIDQPEGTGTFYDASDVSTGVTASFRLTSQLSFATTVKYVQERIYEVTAGGLAVDAGAYYETGFRSLNLGFSLSNLGFDQTFTGQPLDVKYNPQTPGEPTVSAELQAMPFTLPLIFRASGSFDILSMIGNAQEDHQLLVAIDFYQQSDTPERLALGCEYTWSRLVSFRGGYLFNADELSWGAGAGVRLAVTGAFVHVDYAASSLGRFGLAHRIGLAMMFGE